MATESPLRESEFRASRFETAVRSGSLAITLLFGGIVLLALVVRLLLVDRIVTPWIMADELIYSEMAKNFADHGEFLVRDSASTLNNVAYPVLIAPAWFAQSIDTAYGLARTINVVVMVLAAVPVYIWGRRLMSAGYALLAAVLVLLMPSLTYTGMLMTENAFFTAVVASCFAIALTLERPTLLRPGRSWVRSGSPAACVRKVSCFCPSTRSRSRSSWSSICVRLAARGGFATCETSWSGFSRPG